MYIDTKKNTLEHGNGKDNIALLSYNLKCASKTDLGDILSCTFGRKDKNYLLNYDTPGYIRVQVTLG